MQRLKDVSNVVAVSGAIVVPLSMNSIVKGLQDLLAGVDSRVPVRRRPLSSVMAVALFPAKVAATVLAGLGVVGWGLTIAGLYGLVAYTVTRRIPEIGVSPPPTRLAAVLGSGTAES